MPSPWPTCEMVSFTLGIATKCSSYAIETMYTVITIHCMSKNKFPSKFVITELIKILGFKFSCYKIHKMTDIKYSMKNSWCDTRLHC